MGPTVLVYVLCTTIVVSGQNTCVEEKVADSATPFVAGKVQEPGFKFPGQAYQAAEPSACTSTGNTTCASDTPVASDGIHPFAAPNGCSASAQISFQKFLLDHPKYNGWTLHGFRCGQHLEARRDI